MTARLVVSLSGIADGTLDDCDALAADLAGRGVPLSLLVAPRPPGGRLVVAAAWAASQAARGAAVVLHGFDHVAPAGTAGMATRFGPGIGRRAEFAALPAHEAGLRLAAATAALERLGLGTDLFAPPRWTASPGTLQALRRRLFALCADATGVHDLRTGAVHHGRVLGFGRTEVAEHWWCRAVVLAAGRASRRDGLLRLAVDAADLRRPEPRQAVLDAVDAALAHGAVAATYRDLLRPAARAVRAA